MLPDFPANWQRLATDQAACIAHRTVIKHVFPETLLPDGPLGGDAGGGGARRAGVVGELAGE